jgi:hypothetical protein
MKRRLALFTFTAARLTAFCRNDADRTGIPPDPCEVLFEFHGTQGRSLKRSAMTLQPGTSAFLEPPAMTAWGGSCG